ncbi:MAG TPA: GNAT family N-acetyltransferase [Spirochaetia bacterium]|nr:MAG: hypothetical protein A2Y41_02145 [Spirochaetes bacterium GWB1_36_13]HCL56208.1 GNAT family N-acetyltransferase [Spirochaetia bacterium]
MEDGIEIVSADFWKERDRKVFLSLLNAYIEDEMGGGELFQDEEQIERLLEGVISHPALFVLLAFKNGEAAGMAVCFTGFSTFQAKKLINIHDFIVKKEFRRQGVGKALLQRVYEEGQKKGCCKITLEVRKDNEKAKKLYRCFGFGEAAAPSYFWSKKIEGEKQ